MRLSLTVYVLLDIVRVSPQTCTCCREGGVPYYSSMYDICSVNQHWFHLGNGGCRSTGIVESEGRGPKREDSGGAVELRQVYPILHALLASRCSLVIAALIVDLEVSNASSLESNMYTVM